MRTPLLFSRRRPVPPADAAQYVGTDGEIDAKESDRELKAAIRALVGRDDPRTAARG